MYKHQKFRNGIFFARKLKHQNLGTAFIVKTENKIMEKQANPSTTLSLSVIFRVARSHCP